MLITSYDRVHRKPENAMTQLTEKNHVFKSNSHILLVNPK